MYLGFPWKGFQKNIAFAYVSCYYISLFSLENTPFLELGSLVTLWFLFNEYSLHGFVLLFFNLVKVSIEISQNNFRFFHSIYFEMKKKKMTVLKPLDLLWEFTAFSTFPCFLRTWGKQKTFIFSFFFLSVCFHLKMQVP